MLRVVMDRKATKACRKGVKRALKVLKSNPAKRPAIRVRDAILANWLKTRCSGCGACPKVMAMQGITRPSETGSPGGP